MSALWTSYLSRKAEGRSQPRKGGHGVFAVEPIVKNEMVAVWGGEVLTSTQVALLPEDRRRLVLQVDEDQFLYSTREGPADWVNHSCDPNCGIRGQVTLVAIRDIEPGEELCFDYAMSESNAFEEFACRCGTPQCRGTLSREDWRRPDLRLRYRGEDFTFFSAYLERWIQQELQALELPSPLWKQAASSRRRRGI